MGLLIHSVNLTKLQSYPEEHFRFILFLCDLDGLIEDTKVQKLWKIGLHCQDFHVLGVF